MKTKAFKKPLSILLTVAMVFSMFAMLGAVAHAEISGSTLAGRYFSTDNVWYDAARGTNGIQWQVGDYPAYNGNLGMTYFNGMYVRIDNNTLFQNVTRDTGVTFAFNYRPNFTGDHRHILSIGQNEYGNGTANQFFISGTTSWYSDGNFPVVAWVNGSGAELIRAYPAGFSPVLGNEYNIIISVDKDEGVVFYIDGDKKTTVYKDSNLNDQIGNVRSFLDEVSTYTNNYIGCSRWTADAKLEGYLSDVRIYRNAAAETEAYSLAADMAGASFNLTAPSFNATAYHYNDPATGAYANLAYASPATNEDSGMGIRGADNSDDYKDIEAVYFKFFTPLNVVMVYDGAHETYASIELETKRHNKTNVQDQRIYYVVSNSSLLKTRHNWYGYLDSAWKTWAGAYTDNQINTDTSLDVYVGSTNDTPRFWWNAIKYTGSGNADTYYDHEQNISFTLEAFFDYTVGSTSKGTGTITTLSNYYVLNYKPVYDVLSSARATYENDMAGKAWIYTEQSYAQAMLAMRRLALCNPNLYDYNGRGVDAAARLCAAAIKQAKANYDAIDLVKKTGTATFNYENGTEFRTVTADYGDTFTVPAVPAKASDAQYDYIDPVWTPAIDASPVMSDDYKDAVYTASYTPSLRSYEITWNYTTAEGAQSVSTTVEYGQTPAAPTEATGGYQTAERVYTFSSWSPAVVPVTQSAAYTAQYTDAARTYEVKFYGLDGSQIGTTQHVAYGAAATAETLPAKAPDAENHYTVTWDRAFNNITSDTNVYATAAGTAHTYSAAPVWGDWTDANTVTAAFTCDGCDNTVTPEVTVTSTATDATCTADAFTVYTARVTMGETEYTNPTTKTVVDENTRTGHTYNTPADADWNWTKSGDTYTAAVTVTCKEGDDTRVLTATVSGPVVVDAQHLTPGSKTFTATATINGQTFTAEKADEIPAEGHSWTYHEAAPSSVCTATGTVAYWSCSGCDELRAANQTDVITSIDDGAYGPHDYGALIAAVAPTCVQDGTVAHYHCSVCEKDFDESKAELDSIVAAATGSHTFNVPQSDETFHWLKCATCEEISGKAEHAYTVKGDDVTPARCGVNATATYSCSCGAASVLEVPDTALEHDFSDLRKDDTYHWYACANEGCEEISGKAEHAYTVKGDDVTPARCGVNATATYSCSCGATSVLEVPDTALEHDFSDLRKDDTYHWYACANEGCEEISGKAEHSGGTATCTALAECGTCHQTYGEFDYNNHSTTETVIKNAVEPGYTFKGYTGDIYCKACDHYVGPGEEIVKLDINENPIYTAAVEVAAEAAADPNKYDADAVTALNAQIAALEAAVAVDDNEEAVLTAIGELETIAESMGASILFTLTVNADNGAEAETKKGTAGSTVDLGTPEKEGYLFKEWAVTAGSVSDTVYTFTDSDATATAVYTVKTGETAAASQEILDNADRYDDDYVAALTEKVDELNAIDASDPANNDEVKAIVDAIDALLAQADDNRAYTVIFTVDGAEVKREKVKTGGSVSAPEQAELIQEDAENHWRFSGWTGDYTNVTADVTVSGAYALEGHDWADGEITKPATCMAAGTQARSCACGATGTKTLDVDPAAHNYGEMIREDSATCTHEGVMAHCTCSLCGKNFNAAHEELESLVIPKLDHTFGEWIPASEANCTDEGVVGHYHCAVCELDYDAEENLLDTVVIPVNEDHDFHLNAEKSKAPGCTEDGYDYYECSRNAEHFYKDTVTHSGHTLHHVEAKAAGCPLHGPRMAPRRGAALVVTGNNGNVEYWYCENCDLYFADADAAVTLTADEIIIPAAHHLIHTEGVPATHTTDGAREYWYCDICGNYFFTENAAEPLSEDEFNAAVTIPAASTHTPGEPVKENEVKATCQAGGHYDLVTYCAEGGEELSRETVTTDIDPNGHVPGASARENVIAATCTASGSYDLTVRCSLCGELLSSVSKTEPAAGHRWGAWEVVRPAEDSDPGEAKRVCSVCGAEESKPLSELEEVTKTIKFINIARMHYELDLGDDETYSVYNSSTVQWISNQPLKFKVVVYSGFNFDDVIVYANGKEIAPDGDGYYSLPQTAETVIVSVSGALIDDSEPSGKLSFWELLLRFFRKIVAFFTDVFAK